MSIRLCLSPHLSLSIYIYIYIYILVITFHQISFRSDPLKSVKIQVVRHNGSTGPVITWKLSPFYPRDSRYMNWSNFRALSCNEEESRGAVTSILDCHIVVSEFELQSRYYVSLLDYYP